MVGAAGTFERRRVLVFFALVLSLCFSVVWAIAVGFEPDSPRERSNDTADYLALYFDLGSNGVAQGDDAEPPSIHQYRILAPLLARLMPDPPPALLAPGRPMDPLNVAALKFAMVNFLFLFGTCVMLFALERDLGLTFPEACLGVLLLLSSKAVVRLSGLPLSETPALFFFTLSVLAIQRVRPSLMFVGSLGILAKELVIAALPIVLVSMLERRQKMALLLAAAPGVLLYALIRIAVVRSPLDDLTAETFSPAYLDDLRDQLPLYLTPNGIVQLALVLGVAWPPFVAAATSTETPPLLRRGIAVAAAVLVLVALVPSMTPGAWSRHASLFAPIAFPVAVLGVRRWLSPVARVSSP